MSSQVQRLTQLFHDARDKHGYSNTSKWHDGLSKAITFLKRAEADPDPFDRFWNAWSSVYNLFTQYGKPGDEEFKMLNGWVSDIQEIPAIRNLFDLQGDPIDIAGMLEKIRAARNHLLRAQGEQSLAAWKPGVTPSAKACRYFFNILQDVRNRRAHPDFNPSNAKVQKALTALAELLTAIVNAAIEVMIEKPVPGTTGRVPIKNFFLWPFLNNADGFFSDYYLERLFPDEELSTFPEENARQQLKELRKALRNKREGLNEADVQNTIKLWCVPIIFPLLGARPVGDIALVGDGIVQTVLAIPKPGSVGSMKNEYYGKEAAGHIACLIWVLPWAASLDAILEDATGTLLPAMEIANKALAMSDVPWAVLTNGRQFRLLSRQMAHKPRCFLEIDLEAACDITRDQDECLKAFRYFQGFFFADGFTDEDDQGATRLERVRIGSERHGKEIGDELKQNVFKALEELGSGFLHYLRSQPEELVAWCETKGLTGCLDECLASETLLDDIYNESLSLMYRLLFLFYAESRNLLPLHNEIYQENYSLESIRDEIISVHDDPDPRHFFSQGVSSLWARLQELFKLVNGGWEKIVPAYNGGLFDTDVHPFLERFMVPDYFLARAIDFLSRTQPSFGQGRGEGRKKVTYRDLDVRHLGSIYEGILEYNARIANADLAVVKRGTGNKLQEEYLPVSELVGREKEDLAVYLRAVEDDPDSPKLPRSTKVTWLKKKGSYFLVYGGRESKRKSSGSYYTPDYIVQYIVDNTLGPLVRGEHSSKPNEKPLNKPLSSEKILKLKILDPAMGSGHFLVAATEYLARAYGEALARERKGEQAVVTDDKFTRYKRIIAERCIYGVDINPMAVELAKLSLWLTTMDPTRSLSFLDHHLRCGNSLVGAWLNDLVELPKHDHAKPKRNVKVFGKQRNVYLQHFESELPNILYGLLKIVNNETITLEDSKTKKALARTIENIKKPFKNIADLWSSYHFGNCNIDYAGMLLLNLNKWDDIICRESNAYRFFHWELEFPEVWFDQLGKRKESGGFSAIIGNPPYLLIDTFGKQSPIASSLSNLYEDIWQDKSDLVMFFLNRSFQLAHTSTMIVKNSILAADKSRLFRAKITNNHQLRFIVDFRNIKIFPDAQVATCIVGLGPSDVTKYISCKDSISELTERIPLVSSKSSDKNLQFNCEETRFANEDPWLFMGEIPKISYQPHASFTQLGSLFEIGEGMQTGLNKAFVISEGSVRDVPLFCRPRIEGKNIKRYHLEKSSKYLLWVEDVSLFDKLPEWIQVHLNSYSSELRSRAAFVRGNCEWYRYTWPLHKDKYSENKLWTSYRNKINAFALDDTSYGIGLTDTTVIFAGNMKEWLSSILGLLNSTYLTMQYRTIGKMTGGGVYEYFKNGISKLLIPNDILCSRQSDLKDEMVCKAIREFSQVRKLIEDLPDPMSREARKLYLTIIGLIAKEITEASKLAKSAIDKVAEFDECIEILTGRLYGVDYKKCKIDEAD